MIGELLQYTSTPEACAAYTSEGKKFYEFSCIYPALDRFYFSFEKYYDPIPVFQLMYQFNWIPVAACVLYGVFIVLGQGYFAKRERWNWRYILALWNLSLSVFSFVGMSRTFPQLLHNMTNFPLHDNMCADPQTMYGGGSSGFWTQMFILSKFPELIDTFFIVIHKKPLIFLHWYHHITVLLYCWHSYMTRTSTGIFFIVMNYSVHASMYFYYFLMAVRCKPRWLNPIVITAMQISQMFVGVFISCLGFYYYTVDPDCFIETENNVAALLMYGSYLFLFLQFFIGRYGAMKTASAKKSV